MSFKSHCKYTKQQLVSLIGKLPFACKVVSAGRIFLRRLINISCTIYQLYHHIRLNQQTHLDIEWWLTLLPSLNGTSYILKTKWSTSTSMSLCTDTASSVGWGAYWCGILIQFYWSSEEAKMNIVWKEILAITARPLGMYKSPLTL